MTALYDPKGLGPRLEIACPACGALARFESRSGFCLPITIRTRAGELQKSWSGNMSCTACGKNGLHELDWPTDSFFRVEWQGKTLRAETRAMLLDIRALIAAETNRGAISRGSRYYAKLVRLPKSVLAANARKPLLAKIDAMLAKSIPET